MALCPPLCLSTGTAQPHTLTITVETATADGDPYPVDGL